MAPSLLLTFLVLLTVQTADNYDAHILSHCLFNSTDLNDIQYIHSFIYNKVEFLRFDSDVGKYVGHTPYGTSLAELRNNNSALMNVMQSQKVAFCEPHAVIWYSHILDKSVKPSVALRSVTPPTGGHTAMLTCSVYDFYPKQIKVTWLRDGQEVTSEVTSSEEMPGGDWLYQIHSHIKYTPRSGEKISCKVEHISLKEPLITHNPSTPESERTKIAIGATGLVLGLVVSLAGFIFYWLKSRDLLPFSSHESES